MFEQIKRLFSVSILALVVFSLAGCKEDSASEQLAKKQLEAITEAEKKIEEGKKAILNNTENPFSFGDKTSKEK